MHTPRVQQLSPRAAAPRPPVTPRVRVCACVCVCVCAQAWWSVATAITPLAAEAGLPVLMAARALMGIGEGVAMPAMNQLLSK